MFNNNLICLLLSLAISISWAQENKKKALIIAISQFSNDCQTNIDKNYCWNRISSTKDIPLITEALKLQGFAAENIKTLKNEEATKRGIIQGLDDLYNRTKESDIVVIHVSSHGQQITDQPKGDEQLVDGYDEAIVPYDAWSAYNTNHYNKHGEKHIRDDAIAMYIDKFRKKIGSNGHLLLLFDTCYSGKIMRGNGKSRGNQNAYNIPYETISSKKKLKDQDNFDIKPCNDVEKCAPVMVISGAQSNHKNFEIQNGDKSYGSLSFIFNRVVKEYLNKQKGFTYQELLSKMNEVMDEYSDDGIPLSQDVQMEPFYALNTIFLNGKYIPTEPQYEITKITKKEIKIPYGKLHQFFKGTTFNVFKAGDSPRKGDKPVAVATIIKEGANVSLLSYNKTLKTDSPKRYVLFLKQKSFGDAFSNVYLYPSVTKVVSNALSKIFKENAFAKIVTDSLKADLFIEQNNQDFLIYKNLVNTPIEISENAQWQEKIKSLAKEIGNIGRRDFLFSVNFNNPAFKIQFELVPIAIDKEDFDSRNYGNYMLLDKNTFHKNGKIRIRAFNATNYEKNDLFVLKLTNKTDRKLYYRILEFTEQGKLFSYLPEISEKNIDPNDMYLEATKDRTFDEFFSGSKDILIRTMKPPCGKIRLKLLASNSPIYFDSSMLSKDEQEDKKVRSTEVGEKSPLDKILSGNNVFKSRNGDSLSAPNLNNVYSQNIDLEIVGCVKEE